MNNKYVLPQAAQDTLGGIKAAAVQDKYTQECRIDKETGKLYTRSADRFLIEDTFEGNPVMSSSCREGNISLIEGYGQSTQATTTGKNLFDIKGNVNINGNSGIEEIYNSVENNILTTTAENSRIGIGQKFRNLNGKTVSFSAKLVSLGTSSKGWIYIYDGGNTAKRRVSDNVVGNTLKINGYTCTTDFVVFAFACEAGGTGCKFTDIQAEIGSTATEYEPYTGGAPSPSPDYPQEIKSLVLDAVKVTGKNLFDSKKLSGGENIEFNGVQCYKYLDNAQSFTFDLSENKIESLYLTIMMYRDSEYADKKITIFLEYSDGERQSNTLTSGAIYNIETRAGKILKKIVGHEGWSQNVYIDLSITQLECGATATEYEPYKEKTIPLSAPITLRGIPSESGNITIDGTNYLSDVIDKEKVTRHIGYIASYNSEDVGDLYISTTGQLTTGATVIYALSEPNTEPLPAEDVQSLADLKTFYPTSIISWETEDGAGVWGKAILKQDMKLYIQNKIKELSNNSVKQIQNINRALLE